MLIAPRAVCCVLGMWTRGELPFAPREKGVYIIYIFDSIMARILKQGSVTISIYGNNRLLSDMVLNWWGLYLLWIYIYAVNSAFNQMM